MRRRNTYRVLIERYPGAVVIGMTATPCRRDGRGLGNIFSAIVECPQVAELIEPAISSRPRCLLRAGPISGAYRPSRAITSTSDLADRMDRSELVGDIVTHWHRLAERRKTVVFATSVEHSIHLRDEFVKPASRPSISTAGRLRTSATRSCAGCPRGDLEVVTNCMVLTEGWDQPDVSVCVLARPTKSLGLFRQMVGRVIRPAPGKDHALIIDHAGAVFMHGFVEDPVIWTLYEDQKAETPAQAARNLSPSRQLLECTKCTAIRIPGEACPSCGFLPQRPGAYTAF